MDDLAIVSDHGFGVFFVSTTTGEIAGSVEIDHDERGLDVIGDRVLVGAETGMSVLAIAWETPIDDDTAPDGGDDTTPADDPQDDVTCGWELNAWFVPVWTCE